MLKLLLFLFAANFILIGCASRTKELNETSSAEKQTVRKYERVFERANL